MHVGNQTYLGVGARHLFVRTHTAENRHLVRLDVGNAVHLKPFVKRIGRLLQPRSLISE